ncbi:SEC-C motif-containing protein [Nitrospirillum amazonense]|uniref:SEC-C motif-containing protein n=1 Tax=Nitrospirillum amazonense TaxID=28077 RepID=A0A560F1Z2_9PROT|nr:DUF4238 domain-containing protein [Nitrospirillum amazonense]TWB15525.1 SEC-C motif-containing protein [Nitrospirillum amazonense]
MPLQVTRDNHYVPQWYQRGFLALGETQLHYLDMSPDQKVLADGRIITMNNLNRRAPKGCFYAFDLYSTHFGQIVNDEVEKFLFGPIDDKGSQAIRAFVSGDPSEVHPAFQDFFEYVDAQKLRTPKGLDWIKTRYASLDQVQLMVEMQGLRLMHCRMWTEGVREIVSAENSEVKFIVSDHPVTFYNASLPPTAADCAYPNDPSIEGIGTQTVFVLDANTCLILTHLEYAKNPASVNLSAPRTNPNFRGSSIVRTDAFIRTRKLSRDQVIAINHLIKSRARRFLAASNRDWLTPEKSFVGEWGDIAQVLLPKDDLWRFGGEIYIGYNDGRTHYQDAFGRTSGAHEYLRRNAQKSNLQPNDLCGCGSGHKFKRCCQSLPFADRPTWEVYGIRERNLMFCRVVEDILGLNAGKTWQDVQRELNEDQVKRIYEAFGSLWPEDTDLPSLLPRPRNGILRAVYLGVSDPRLIGPMVLGWLPYFDEVILAHPFVNPVRLKPEYSPTVSPSQYKEQTLKNVLLLLELEPFIHAGYVHLIPDPGDIDAQFGASMLQMATERTADSKPSSALDGWHKAMADDDHRRLMLRQPEASLRRRFRQITPELSDKQIDTIVSHAKSELETDPYALLQPMEMGEAGAQLLCFKGYGLEVGMYLASLTGSVIYTDLDVHWQYLHMHGLEKGIVENAQWAPAVKALSNVEFPLELQGWPVLQAIRMGRFGKIKVRSGTLTDALLNLQEAPQPDKIATQISSISELVQREMSKIPIGNRLTGRIGLSVPSGGFQRQEVQRLLLTFGRVKATRPIPFAMCIKFEALATLP